MDEFNPQYAAMPDNAGGAGTPNNASHLGLVLPQGAKPLRRRIVWGVGVGILAERLGVNVWAKHSHAHWQIVITFSPAVGEIAWNSPSGKNERQQISGSQVWIIPPGLSHSIRWLVPADAIFLYVEPDRIPAKLRDYCPDISAYSLTQVVAVQPSIADLCSDLRDLCQQPEDVVDWRIAGAGTLLAAILIESHTALATGGLTPLAGVAPQILAKMKEHVAKLGNERVPVRTLARNLGISSRHFRRIVRQITGTSPQKFVILFKIQTAKTLLQSGTHNVSEAARAAGFSDPAHLNRRMQATYGVSPKAFLPRMPGPFRA